MRSIRCAMLVCLAFTGCGQVIVSSDSGASDGGIADVVQADAFDGPDIDGSETGASDTSTIDGSACTYRLESYPCNALPQSALLSVGCTSTPPSAIGGAIVDGVYDLVNVDWDTTADGGATCPSGFTRRGTIEVCGNVLLWLDYDENASIWRGNTHIVSGGASISFQEFCSGNTTFTFSYTATSTGLVMFWQYPQGERLIMSFVRQ